MHFLIPALAVLLRMLVVRLIVAFGISVVSFVGYAYALQALRDALMDAFSQMPDAALNLLLIGGFGTGLGYLFGAFTFRITMTSLNKLTFNPPGSS